VAGAHLDPAFTLAKIGEVGLASLMSAGLDANTARHIVLTATHYTFGHVIEEQAAPTPDQLNDFDMDTFMQPFPHLQKAIAAAMQQGIDPDTEFNTGLRYIIKGATALAEPA
jgi:TetR/AcrR family transcriptional regulator, tetracycline repressor protein